MIFARTRRFHPFVVTQLLDILITTTAGMMLVGGFGDYGEIAITSSGKTIATWGEGLSYNGPGGAWFNRQN